MAPIQSDGEIDDEMTSVSGSDIREEGVQADALLEDGEEEFHTDDSDISDNEAEHARGQQAEDGEGMEEDDSDTNHDAPAIPLLPESLLKSLPRQAPPTASIAGIPYAELTRKQKHSRRRNEAKMRKRARERVRADLAANGELSAKEVEDKLAAVAPKLQKKKTRDEGRKDSLKKIVKREGAAAQVGGRQRLMAERKKRVEKGGSGVQAARARRVGRAKAKGKK